MFQLFKNNSDTGRNFEDEELANTKFLKSMKQHIDIIFSRHICHVCHVYGKQLLLCRTLCYVHLLKGWYTQPCYTSFFRSPAIVLYAWNMHDELLFIIMCQNEIKTTRKWHIDSCSLAPVCVFSRSAKFPPCDPPAKVQRDFILQSPDGRLPTGSRHLESSSLILVPIFTLLCVHDLWGPSDPLPDTYWLSKTDCGWGGAVYVVDGGGAVVGGGQARGRRYSPGAGGGGGGSPGGCKGTKWAIF